MVFLFVLRLVVGSIFLLASAAKLATGKIDATEVFEYGLVTSDQARWIARVLPFAEAIVAVFLLSGIFLVIGDVIAVFLLGTFTVATGSNVFRGRRIECHCFGSWRRTTIGPGTLLRNIVLLAFAISLLLGEGVALRPQWASDIRLLSSEQSLVPIVGLALLAGCLLFLVETSETLIYSNKGG